MKNETSDPLTFPLPYYFSMNKIITQISLRKPFLKKSDKKIGKKQKINVKMPHVNEKSTSEILKFNSNKKIRLRMSCEWIGKTILKKTDPKNRKNSKNQSEIAACEQKTTTEKPNFCSNTVFSLYFKIRAKRIHAAKPLAFAPFPVSA